MLVSVTFPNNYKCEYCVQIFDLWTFVKKDIWIILTLYGVNLLASNMFAVMFECHLHNQNSVYADANFGSFMKWPSFKKQ